MKKNLFGAMALALGLTACAPLDPSQYVGLRAPRSVEARLSDGTMTASVETTDRHLWVETSIRISSEDGATTRTVAYETKTNESVGLWKYLIGAIGGWIAGGVM